MIFYHYEASQCWDDTSNERLFSSFCWWNVSFFKILTHFHLAENMWNWLIYYCQHSLNKSCGALCLAICAIWITSAFHSWCSLVTAIQYGWMAASGKQAKARKHKIWMIQRANISQERDETAAQQRHQPRYCILWCTVLIYFCFRIPGIISFFCGNWNIKFFFSDFGNFRFFTESPGFISGEIAEPKKWNTASNVHDFWDLVFMTGINL